MNRLRWMICVLASGFVSHPTLAAERTEKKPVSIQDCLAGDGVGRSCVDLGIQYEAGHGVKTDLLLAGQPMNTAETALQIHRSEVQLKTSAPLPLSQGVLSANESPKCLVRINIDPTGAPVEVTPTEKCPSKLQQHVEPILQWRWEVPPELQQKNKPMSFIYNATFVNTSE